MINDDRLRNAMSNLVAQTPESSAFSFDSVFLADFARCVTVAECVTGSVETAKHVVIDAYVPIHLAWEELQERPGEVDVRAQAATVALSLRAKEMQPELPNEFKVGAHPGRRIEDGPLMAVAELEAAYRATIAATYVFGGDDEQLAEQSGRKLAAFQKDFREAMEYLNHVLGPAGADPAIISRAFRSRTNRHGVNDDRFVLLAFVKDTKANSPQSGAYESDRKGPLGFLRR